MESSKTEFVLSIYFVFFMMFVLNRSAVELWDLLSFQKKKKKNLVGEERNTRARQTACTIDNNKQRRKKERRNVLSEETQ
jgi:hypothetical protein